MLETKLLNGDWRTHLRGLINGSEEKALSLSVQTPLASAIQLEMLFGTKRARELIRISRIIPEIDREGNRRCTHLDKHGVRCTRYAKISVCDLHFERACMLSNMFKSDTLRKEYEKLLGSKYKMHLDGELAMMRLMLGMLIQKIDANGNMTIEHVGAVTAMCEKISGVVDKMSKMNTITPETIDKMIGKIVDVVSVYVNAEDLEKIAEQVARIQPTVNACDIEYMPGESVNIMGDMKEIEAVPLHKRQLIELAAQIGVETDVG
jgi:hypothetical protein